MLSYILLFCSPMDCSPLDSSVSGISWATVPEWVATPFFRGSACKWRGEIFTGKRGVSGSSPLIFHPSSISLGKEGFLSLFSLDQKYRGASEWWVLIYCNESIKNKKIHSGTRNCCLSPPFFATGTHHQKYVVSCQSWGSCFSLSACRLLLFTRSVISWILASASISLLKPNYLPAVTKDGHCWIVQPHVVFHGVGVGSGLGITLVKFSPSSLHPN